MLNRILVPDVSYTGVLSTLAVTIDFSQYLLLRGLLMFNLGECLDDLLAQDEDIAHTFSQVGHITTLAYAFSKVNLNVYCEEYGFSDMGYRE